MTLGYLINICLFFVFRFFWGWYGVWNRNSTIRLCLPPPKKKYWKNYLTIHFLEKYSLCMCEFTVKKWFVKYFFQYFLWGGGMRSRILEFRFQMPYHPQKKWKTKNQKKILKKIFDKSFFNSDFSHTKTIFSQKMNCQIIFLIFFFVFSFSFFSIFFGLVSNPVPPKKNEKRKTKKKILKKLFDNSFFGKI